LELLKFFFFGCSRILIKIYGIYHKFESKLGEILIDKFAFPLLSLYGKAPEIYDLENFIKRIVVKEMAPEALYGQYLQ
jgi:hypothetical protein